MEQLVSLFENNNSQTTDQNLDVIDKMINTWVKIDD